MTKKQHLCVLMKKNLNFQFHFTEKQAKLSCIPRILAYSLQVYLLQIYFNWCRTLIKKSKFSFFLNQTLLMCQVVLQESLRQIISCVSFVALQKNHVTSKHLETIIDILDQYISAYMYNSQIYSRSLHNALYILYVIDCSKSHCKKTCYVRTHC